MAGAGDEVTDTSPASGVHAARRTVHPPPKSGPAGPEARHRPRDRDDPRLRLADHELVEALAADDFSGRRFDDFRMELAAYGIPVLCGWMQSGYVFRALARLGVSLYPTEQELERLARDPELRDRLATMTVAVALLRFTQHALVEKGWTAEGGASLTTYFTGTCLYVFPNEYRAYRRDEQKWIQAHRAHAATLGPAADHEADPAAAITANIRVLDELARTESPAQEVLALVVDGGYSHEEIAEILQLPSARSVEGILYRLRKQRRQAHRGGATDGAA